MDVFRNSLQHCFVFCLLISCPDCNVVSVENSSLQMVFDVFVCCPLLPRETNIVPALVPVARACPSVDLSSLEEDVEGPDGSSGGSASWR